MTATRIPPAAVRPFDALLTDALTAAGLKPLPVDTWIEDDDPPTRPGPRLHFEVRLKGYPRAYFSGEYQMGWGHSDEEIAGWIANRCLDSKDWPHWRGISDRGLGAEYVQVRPIASWGWGPESSGRLTGRKRERAA